MAESLLDIRIRRFRHWAYLGAAALVASVATATPSNPLVVGIAYFVLAPHALAWLQRRSVAKLQEAENVVTAAVVLVLGLPLVPAMAIVAALLTGTVAQRGFKGVLPASLTLTLGAAIGAMARGAPPHPSTFEADLLGLLFILVYTTPLSALGFEQTMKMHQARSGLHAKTIELQALCARLSRYLAPSVYRRIVEDRSPTARLRRVYVTVCFVDLADFTGLTDRLAPEELASLLNDFLLEVSSCAARAGGTVDKFLGDGVLVYFGDPTTEGPPADARACLEMTRRLPARLAALHDRWRQQGIAVHPQVRIGIASGFCTVGDFGGDERLDHTIVGKAVNLASRLKDEARLGEVLVADAVRVLVGDDLTGALPRRVAVKGLSVPVDAAAIHPSEESCFVRAPIDGATPAP